MRRHLLSEHSLRRHLSEGIIESKPGGDINRSETHLHIEESQCIVSSAFSVEVFHFNFVHEDIIRLAELWTSVRCAETPAKSPHIFLPRYLTVNHRHIHRPQPEHSPGLPGPLDSLKQNLPGSFEEVRRSQGLPATL